MAIHDTNPTQGFSAANDQLEWGSEDTHWRKNWSSRPYAAADRSYEDYQPGYHYGYDAAVRHRGKHWNDVEPELRGGWDRYEGRGESTWESMKDAVRDAWDRVTNR